MQTSKLYSTKTFTLDCGTVIALPKGLSIHRIKATKSSIAVIAYCRGESLRLSAQPNTIIATILKACQFMADNLAAGWLPGHSLSTSEDKLSLSYKESNNAYMFTVGYPCIERLAYRRKTFYVGTSNTKDQHIAIVRTQVNQYRKDRLRDYCDWFGMQLKTTIDELTAILNKGVS